MILFLSLSLHIRVSKTSKEPGGGEAERRQHRCASEKRIVKMELPKNANQLNRSELENILEEIHDEVDTLLDLEDEELRQKPELLKERASRLKVKMKEYLRYCRELKKN